MTTRSASSLQHGFMVVHGNYPEQLRALLVQWLQAYPLDVFTSETVLVQSNGIAQWLKLALAQPVAQGGLGIAAALDLVMPHRLVWQLYRTVLAGEAIPLQCAFDKDQLHWRLLRLLPQVLAAPDPAQIYQELRQYLTADQQLNKTDQLCHKLADLFDQYQVYRADWLAAWQAGDDQLIDGKGQVQPLLPQQRWQAALWRAVLLDMPPEQRQWSRASLHQRFLQACRSQRSIAGLPPRILVFGVSSLSQQSLEALCAVAPFCQVLLTVHNPCQYYWADIISDKDLFRSLHRRQQAKPAPAMAPGITPAPAASHPLLAAWGKQGRDYIRLLDEFDQTASHKALFAGERVDLFSDYDTSHLLGMLQQDILELRPLTETSQHWPALAGEQLSSISFACCHSVVRELEVLHDDLLEQLRADPALQYSDFMVMVPDIHQYAAAIHAVFGRYPRDDARYIPFTIADQSAGAEQPMVQALRFLLDIRNRRLTISELIDFLQTRAVAARFDLDDSAVWQLCQWLEQAGAHWGLHGAQRQSLGVEFVYDESSLLSALRRMLLGYACGEVPTAVAGVLPLPQVAGLSAQWCGALADLLLQLEHWWQLSVSNLSPQLWYAQLQQLLAQFFQPEHADDIALLASLRTELTNWFSHCQAAQLHSDLPLQVISNSWLAGFEQGNLAQRFLTGAVNFATLLPMRAIPFAQVHLLGMQDGAFPRVQRRQDFDLMSLHYRPGDRSRREDDRYLMLEALLSARQRLRISWLGRSVHDNTEREPSVLVTQLRQHLASGWRLADGGDLLNALTTEYPLKPYSSRYQSGELYSYQYEWLQYRQGNMAPQATQPPPNTANPETPGAETLIPAAARQVRWCQTEASPLAESPIPDLSLRQICAFVQDPVRWFFQQRLRVHFGRNAQQHGDDERFVLDNLQHWQLRQQLLQQSALTLARRPESTAVQVAQALAQTADNLAGQALLPLGAAGDIVRQLLCQELTGVLTRYAQALGMTAPASPDFIRLRYVVAERAGNSDSAQPAAASAQGCGPLVISDWLSGVRYYPDLPAAGYRQFHLFSETLFKDGQWQLRPLLVPLLSACIASAAGVSVRQQVFAPDRSLLLPDISQAQACAYLQSLSAQVQRGWCRPLPFQLKLGALALQSKQDERWLTRLAQKFTGDDFNPGLLDENPYLARAYADFASFWSDEAAALCQQLLAPLLQWLESAEEQSDADA